ncbi:MAG: radical SAM protein [Deltaproteobacteria bacterium]|nr:radical SAM protein [Deltaproteobacteria bacterium]
MQLSRFVVTYENVRPSEHILYSVLTDQSVGIDDATRDALRRWESGSRPRNASERATIQALTEDGFLVPSRETDDQALMAHLDKASEGIEGTMMVTLMPTLACNLACGYCFQKDSPAFNTMHRETEDATLEWILNEVDKRGMRTLSIHYFGGEPLNRKEFCVRSAEVLSSAMRARGGSFNWTMTTNGVELTPEFAKRMVAHGPGAIKVTLEGDKDTHDKVRVYRNGKGTFDRILDNVISCSPIVKMRVGGNFLPHEGPSYERLLDRLEAAGLANVLDGVKFKPRQDIERDASGCSGCSHQSQEATQTLVQLNRSISKRKLGTHEGEALEGMLGPCELHWKNNVTIDPDGLIYKCPAVAGRPELAVGKVTEDAPLGVAPLVKSRPWEKCGDCAYMPVCVGGCLGGQWIRTGRTDQVDCRKEAFERAFEDTIKRRYLAEFGEGEADWETVAA